MAKKNKVKETKVEYVNNNVRIILLNTNQYIIGEIYDNDVEYQALGMKNVYRIIYAKTSEEEPTAMYMVPFMSVTYCNENVMQMYTSNILSVSIPNKSLLKYYGDIVNSDWESVYNREYLDFTAEQKLAPDGSHLN